MKLFKLQKELEENPQVLVDLSYGDKGNYLSQEVVNLEVNKIPVLSLKLNDKEEIELHIHSYDTDSEQFDALKLAGVAFEERKKRGVIKLKYITQDGLL